MSDDRSVGHEKDVLLKFIEEHWSEIRHIEDQRERIAGLVALISSGALGVMFVARPETSKIPIALLLVVAGTVGGVATEKLYERYRFLQSRLDHWYRTLDRLIPGAEFLAAREIADEEHKRGFRPRMFVHMRLHWIWLLFNISAIVLGTYFLIWS